MFQAEVEVKYHHQKLLSEANQNSLLKQISRGQPNRARQLLRKIKALVQAVSLQTNKGQQINRVTQVNLGSEQV